MTQKKRMVYQLRFGSTVLGQFDSKAAVKRGKKELKEKGIDARIYTVFIADEPVKKRTIRKKRVKRKETPWTDDVPLIVSFEAANQLAKGWENISDPFMLGSYRGGELCTPIGRTSDLSIQPKDDGLALCYHTLSDGKVYLVLDRLDVVSVVGKRLSIGGMDSKGDSVMMDFRIEDSPIVSEAMMDRSGWYYMGGPIVHIGKPIILDDESRAFGVLANVPFLAVYPDTLGRRPYSVGRGSFEITERNGLDDRLNLMFGCGPREKMPVRDPDSLDRAFRKGDIDYLTRMQTSMPHLDGFDFTVRSNSIKSVFGRLFSKGIFDREGGSE